MRLRLLIIFFMCLGGWLSAKNDTPETDRLNRFRVGAASSYSFLYEQNYPSFEVSYIRVFNRVRLLSVGFAYEQIVRDNLQHTFFVPIEFNSFKGISFSVLPGFSFNDEQPFTYTTKLEAAYRIPIKRLELSPFATLTLNMVENYAAAGIKAGFLF